MNMSPTSALSTDTSQPEAEKHKTAMPLAKPPQESTRLQMNAPQASQHLCQTASRTSHLIKVKATRPSAWHADTTVSTCKSTAERRADWRAIVRKLQ